MQREGRTQEPLCVALIVAGGASERFGAALPKQYERLCGVPVLRHTVLRFVRHPAIATVQVVLRDGHRELYERAVEGLALQPAVNGGTTRQESVRAGLEALTMLAPSRVLVHDAARPLVSTALIDRVIRALDEEDGVIPALPVTDSLKRVSELRTRGGVSRDGLFRAQTPQGFRFTPLLAAHRRQIGRAHTDDAAILEAEGIEVAVVMGEEDNIKITMPEDLVRAERVLAGSRTIRTSSGFDVHRFAEDDRPLILGGVHLAGERGLAGHSDADVLLHAITDALLGAIAAGDIGSHFPPSDERWRDADSALFVRHAAGLLRERGGRIEHIDATLICERPKIGPHRGALRARIAELLALSLDAVSLKATTTERLGFTGRGEGIAAQAIATVSLPATAG